MPRPGRPEQPEAKRQPHPAAIKAVCFIPDPDSSPAVLNGWSAADYNDVEMEGVADYHGGKETC